MWVATLGATVLVAIKSLHATTESLPIIATATHTAAAAVIELDDDAYRVALLYSGTPETAELSTEEVRMRIH